MKSEQILAHKPDRPAVPCAQVRAGAATDIASPVLPEGTHYRNKELNLSHQFAALFLLFFVWVATVVLVIGRQCVLWHTHPNPLMGLTYADPVRIYSIVFGAMPLALVLIGVIFWMRIRPSELGPRHLMLYDHVTVLWILLICVLLIYCAAWNMGSGQSIRE